MSNATALLALSEFSVEHVFEFVDEAIVALELPRAPLACHRCGVVALHRVHDRAVHRVRDLPAAGRAVVLVWHKRVLACLEGCATFRARSEQICRVPVGRSGHATRRSGRWLPTTSRSRRSPAASGCRGTP